MDIYDIIDNIYKLPLASKEALLNETPEVTYPKMNILFTDKTGTLTSGQMTAETVFSGDGTRFDGMQSLHRHALALFGQIYADCRYNTGATLSISGIAGGNATDRALLRAIASFDIGRAEPACQRIPFDSSRKYAAVRLPQQAQTLVRGAPELLLPRCSH